MRIFWIFSDIVRLHAVPVLIIKAESRSRRGEVSKLFFRERFQHFLEFGALDESKTSSDLVEKFS